MVDNRGQALKIHPLRELILQRMTPDMAEQQGSGDL